MKLIEIKKHYAHGTRELFIFLSNSECFKDHKIDHESIQHHVEERCELDPAGQNTGWDSEWKFVTDPKVIKEHARNKIDQLLDEANEIAEFQRKLFKLI